MNAVKRIARKRYYLRIGLPVEAADMASDNRIFRGSQHPGDAHSEKEDIAQRESRARAFVNRTLNHLGFRPLPRR